MREGGGGGRRGRDEQRTNNVSLAWRVATTVVYLLDQASYRLHNMASSSTDVHAKRPRTELNVRTSLLSQSKQTKTALVNTLLTLKENGLLDVDITKGDLTDAAQHHANQDTPYGKVVQRVKTCLVTRNEGVGSARKFFKDNVPNTVNVDGFEEQAFQRMLETWNVTPPRYRNRNDLHAANVRGAKLDSGCSESRNSNGCQKAVSGELGAGVGSRCCGSEMRNRSSGHVLPLVTVKSRKRALTM